MGFAGELTKYADHQSGSAQGGGRGDACGRLAPIATNTIKSLYDKIGKKPDVEILHLTEYLHRLIKDGAISIYQGNPTDRDLP